VTKNLFHFLDQLSTLGLDSAVVVVEGFGKEGNRVRQDCQIILALLVQEQVDDVQDEQANLKKVNIYLWNSKFNNIVSYIRQGQSAAHIVISKNLNLHQYLKWQNVETKLKSLKIWARNVI